MLPALHRPCPLCGNRDPEVLAELALPQPSSSPLPAGYRLGEQLVLDACRAFWPELLEYPFNEFAGLRRYPRRIAKSIYYAGRRALAGLRRR